MKIAIMGGTGMIGSTLTEELTKKGHDVIIFTRNTNLISSDLKSEFFPKFVSVENPDFSGIDAVINLAGEPIGGVRWTSELKKEFYHSRVDFTKRMVQAYLSTPESKRPKIWLQGSAIGYYGFSKDRIGFTEETGSGSDFLSQLSVDWEKASEPVESSGARRVILRIGVVLSRKGGALAKMLPAFLAFVGGPIGSGNQGMSWIAESDLISAILFSLENHAVSGPINLTSPTPVNNEEFSNTLARIVHRPCIFRVPELSMKVLFGEGATVITEGQWVFPKKLESYGFKFEYSRLDMALQRLFSSVQKS
jgi:uncharacterized protein (TIGR01777 family)